MNLLRHVITIATLLASCAGGAHAQLIAPPPTSASSIERLTLQRAEALFNERNREIRAARRLAEGAEADIISARARPNPTLSVGSTVSPSTGIGSGNLRDKNINAAVSVTQLFERGGKRELRTQAAEYTAAAARSEEADVARQQRGALYGAYFDLVLAQEKIRVTEDTAALFGRTVDAANLRLKAGDISPTELARISVDALRAQNDARTARAERDKAQLVLGYLIGGEQNAAHIVAVDTWPLDEQLPSMAAVEGLVGQRADVQAARSHLQAAERQRELARALRTRDVVAGVTYDRSADFAPNAIGVTMSVPLFTSYYYQGEIRRAEVELEAAEENVERVRALALADVQRAMSELAAATERVRRFREVLLAAAEKAANGAEFAYSRGAIGVMDLLDARRQLYATRLESVAAQADYARALAAWRAATATR